VWDQIEKRCKLTSAEKLAKQESQLMSLKFPAYGCVILTLSRQAMRGRRASPQRSIDMEAGDPQDMLSPKQEHHRVLFHFADKCV
jgi:hypothetical protein